MTRTYPDLPGWSFEIDEESAGVYQVVAKDARGRTIVRVATDPEFLIDECRREAADLSQRK